MDIAMGNSEKNLAQYKPQLKKIQSELEFFIPLVFLAGEAILE